MHRYLNYPHPAAQRAIFDDTNGKVVGFSDEAAKGAIFRKGETFVAVYGFRGDLLVQIGTDKFPMAQSKLSYAHNFIDETTTFKIVSGATQQSLVYPAWWAELGLDPEEIKYQPERDEDEDNLAWLVEISKNQEAREKLIVAWSTN